MMSESFSRSSPALKEHREELAAERSNTSATSGEANPYSCRVPVMTLVSLLLCSWSSKAVKRCPWAYLKLRDRIMALAARPWHLQELEPLV